MYQKSSLLAAALLLAACIDGDDPISDVPIDNVAPIIAAAIADQTAQVGYAYSLELDGTFSDADNDPLTLSVDFGGDSKALDFSGTTISGTPNSSGAITITVTATDPAGLSVSESFELDISIDQSAIAAVFNGAIDLTNLANYAGQPVPDYITRINTGGNPITDAGATLGRVLFYDTSLSTDGTASCASCHIQSLAFSDSATVSAGVEGGETGRHSMRLINTMFAEEEKFFWDERAPSHEAQESQPLQSHDEMGFSGEQGRPDLDVLIAQMEATEYYEELFRFVFLDPEITETRIQLALAQFTKSIQSFDSRYDEGRAQVNGNNDPFPNFTADENAGETLFTLDAEDGGAGCDICHRAPEFDIVPDSFPNGIFRVAGSSTEFDLTVVRSPSLRDMVGPGGRSNDPFMHDGSLATIREMIDHYDNIPVPTNEPPRSEFLNTLDLRLAENGQPRPLNLTEAEKAQLEAFMLTLTGVSIYSDEKLSDPF